MGAAAAVTSGLGVAGGAINFFENKKRERAAEDALANFKFEDLKNAHEGRSVSTLGADLMREENARISSSSVDALRGAGSRGLIGGLGRVQQQNTLLNRQVAADLDMQRKEIDRDIANDDIRIRDMIESRQRQELQGIGAELEAARQGKANGISTMIQSAQGAAMQFGGGGSGSQSFGKTGIGSLAGSATGTKTNLLGSNYRMKDLNSQIETDPYLMDASNNLTGYIS